MKSPSPAFSFYPKDILSDEQARVMTLEERGAYLTLLCHAWLEGSIPRDPERLARLLGVRPSKLKRMWPAIEGCWSVSPDSPARLIQARLERERERQRDYSAKQAARGKNGGRPKESTKQETRGKAAGLPDETRTKPGKSLPFPSPSPSPVTELSSRQAPPNPLVDRQKLEREWYELIPVVAKAKGLDPTEVARKVTAWRGGGYVNVASIPDDRLAQSMVTLRSLAREIRGEPEPALPAPEPTHPPPRATASAVTTNAMREILAEEAAKHDRSGDVHGRAGGDGASTQQAGGQATLGRLPPGDARGD